jgi:hypothetical protein
VARIAYLRRALPILTVVVLIAAAYDAWIFYSRWSNARSAERERSRAEAETDRRTIEMLGGDQLKILGFYAAPPTIQRGQTTSLCFGVNAAKTVRIEPPVVEDLHPSVSRCFQISPRKNTEYKLTATDAAGHSVSQIVTIQVR